MIGVAASRVHQILSSIVVGTAPVGQSCPPRILRACAIGISDLPAYDAAWIETVLTTIGVPREERTTILESCREIELLFTAADRQRAVPV